MTQSVSVAVSEVSQVGEARRTAALLAQTCGLDETDRGRVALIVTEAANNIIQHGGGGEILLQILPGTDMPGVIQIIALDKGPGMSSVPDSLRDGFSTAGTAGEGLGAIERSSSVFDAYSYPGEGTVIFSQVRPKSTPASAFWHVGVVSIPKPGETVCGDAWAAHIDSPAARFMVADGLGHGPLASTASQTAVDVFDSFTDTEPVLLLEQVHAALRTTRGAAVAAAFVDGEQMRFVGVGNIAGAIATYTDMNGLASYNGTAGGQIHKLREFEYSFPLEGTLVMASDGVSASWRFGRYPGILDKHPALLAALIYRDCGRSRDDATVLVARRTGASVL